MDFVRSHFGKMKLWPVEHFWLTFFPDQHWISTDLEKKWAKSVQLVRVSFFRSDFLQNPYFSEMLQNLPFWNTKTHIFFSFFILCHFIFFMTCQNRPGGYSLGKKYKVAQMKKKTKKIYLGFHIPKNMANLKHFAGSAFYQVSIFYFWIVNALEYSLCVIFTFLVSFLR